MLLASYFIRFDKEGGIGGSLQLRFVLSTKSVRILSSVNGKSSCLYVYATDEMSTCIYVYGRMK